MKFYDGKTSNDEIIESLKERPYNYEVKFLHDKNIYSFSKLDPDSQHLLFEMLCQAKERDEELYNKYKGVIYQDIAAYLAALVGTAFLTNGNSQLLSCFLFMATVYFWYNLKKDIRKKFELKKYHIFLDIRKELQKPENKNILDIIECDKIYQDPRGVTLENLDDYSYFDIKTIKKELKRRNN